MRLFLLHAPSMTAPVLPAPHTRSILVSIAGRATPLYIASYNGHLDVVCGLLADQRTQCHLQGMLRSVDTAIARAEPNEGILAASISTGTGTGACSHAPTCKGGGLGLCV